MPGLGLLGWVALRVCAAAMLFCAAYEAVWPRTNGQFLTGCWLLFALLFKGLCTLAAFLLLCALQALPVNVIIIIITYEVHRPAQSLIVASCIDPAELRLSRKTETVLRAFPA